MNRRRGVDDESSDDEGHASLGPGAVKSEEVREDTPPGLPRSRKEKAPKREVDSDNDNDEDEGDGDRASDSERDSSDESSDDDEDELARVRDGFIVDSDDEGEPQERSRKRRRHKHRKREPTAEEMELSEDDLDLLGLATTGATTGAESSDAPGTFKRLKRAGKDSSSRKNTARGLDAMFDDADEDGDEDDDLDDEDAAGGRGGRRSRGGEFDDFIEADEFSDDEEQALREEEQREIGRRQTRTSSRIGGRAGVAAAGLASVGDLAGLDEDKLSEIYEVFGDGEMYDWALANEEDDVENEANPPQPEDLQLTDVFEPSELAARMLTTEDNAIRSEDLPERYQLLRAKLRQPYEFSDDTEYVEKKTWIADQLMILKEEVAESRDSDEHDRRSVMELRDPLRRAIEDVVDCISLSHLEVPFIWHHRQDFLVHFSSAESSAERTQLLKVNDLWRILDLDMDFHAMLERRRAVDKLRKSLDPGTPAAGTASPQEVDKLVEGATSGVEYQDLVDFIQFIGSSQLRAARRHSRFSQYDRVRAGPTMELVDALRLDVGKIAQVLSEFSSISRPKLPGREQLDAGSDSALTPSELAAELGRAANVEDAVSYVSFALSVDPRVRQFFRKQFEQSAHVDLVLTDDGRKKITGNSPFADLKYSTHWTLSELKSRPELFLRMLKAENQGLVIVRAQYPMYKSTLYADFENLLSGSSSALAQRGLALNSVPGLDAPGLNSDTSAAAAAAAAALSLDPVDSDSWTYLRNKVAKAASRLVVPLVARNILESLRASCIRSLRYSVRDAFADRLDQAPVKPAGYVLGTVPRALCVSAGEGGFGDAVLAAVVDEDGHVTEVVKLGDARSPKFREALVQTVQKAQPDVVGVAGFTPSARRLHDAIKETIENAQLKTGPDDAEQPLGVRWVQDEVARLYRNSERGAIEFPDLVPNARYCVALARYLQSPLLEYAQLDPTQLRSLLLHEDQQLLPDDDFAWALESAFVDSVCDEGIDINVAVRSAYHASALPYVAGLGPRKASSVLQAVLARAKSGQLQSRMQMVELEMTTRTVFMNCASFLRIPWSSTRGDGGEAEYLDSTRIHPEDYELARKTAADALELDEEDVEAIEDRQIGGVVGKLIEEDTHGAKLDELVLEEYAEELEQLFKQRKRITLEQIRREIQDPYRELRHTLMVLGAEQVFTMLTGETPKSFHRGMVVSGTVSRVTGRQLTLTLGGGIDAIAESGNMSDDRSVPLQQQFAPGQAVPAEVLSVDYGALFARVNTRASAVKDAQRRIEQRALDERDPKHWDFEAERRDAEHDTRRAEQKMRQMRVIKHPLFRPFSAKEAEAFLAPLQRGDLVIRPSSRGLDHLVVTWKVADQIYQHIDVLEQDKPNDYAVGRSLLVGAYRYADLDELIIMHVQSMARKVDEMAASEKFQKGNRHDVERWLKAYTNARPNQSVYAFCFDHRRPGYFLLCYQLGATQPIKEVHVKVIPNGYELMRNAYTDVQALSNGFKMMVQRMR